MKKKRADGETGRLIAQVNFAEIDISEHVIIAAS